MFHYGTLRCRARVPHPLRLHARTVQAPLGRVAAGLAAVHAGDGVAGGPLVCLDTHRELPRRRLLVGRLLALSGLPREIAEGDGVLLRPRFLGVQGGFGVVSRGHGPGGGCVVGHDKTVSIECSMWNSGPSGARALREFLHQKSRVKLSRDYFLLSPPTP